MQKLIPPSWIATSVSVVSARGRQLVFSCVMLALGLGHLACAPAVAQFSPYADWERGADLEPGKTFVLARSPRLPETLGADQKRLALAVEATIKSELAKKGYQLAPAESAQLVVSFHALVRERQEVEVQPRDCLATSGELSVTAPAAQSQSMMLACEESIVTTVDEGTLIVDVFDAKTRTLLWHGWASGDAPDRSAPGTVDLVKRVTARILSRFPPK